MDGSALFASLLILISPAIGSFLAVLADRLPRGVDVLRAPSSCQNCRARIAPWDLIPLASYLFLKGRCRACGAAIPPFVFYTELLALGAAVLAVLAGGDDLAMGLAALWLWLLIALAMCDLLWFRLPDPLTLVLALTTVALAGLPGGIGLSAAVIGAALGAGCFALLRWGYFRLRGRVGLGLGDIKLMVGLGGFAGPFDLSLLLLVAALLALCAVGLTRGQGSGLSGTRALPFGAALCGAAGLLWLLRAAS